MPETSRFFDSTQGDARTYSAADFAEYFATMVTSGVWAEELDALELYSTDTNMTSTLKAGRAFINGHYYESDTAMPMTHDAADATYDRIDRVVLRLNLNAEARNIKATILKGTPSETPIAPALTQDSTVYEIPIAQVLIPAASGVVLDANITDERQYARYKTKPEWYPEGSVPQEAYMYQLFKNELTAQEISDIEANPSLMAIINGNPIAADTVDGAHLSTDGTLASNSDIKIPSEKAVKTYVGEKTARASGTWSDTTTSISAGSTYKKTISLGMSASRGKFISTGYASGDQSVVFFNTSQTGAVGITSDGGVTSVMSNAYYTTNPLSDYCFGPYISIQNAYISGTNLEIVLKNNNDTGARTIYARNLNWEVEK